MQVGALIGAGWMTYGLLEFSRAVQIGLGLAGLVVVVWLLLGSRRLISSARSLPRPDATAQAAGRRTWILFWINFAVEIVLLNVAINLLSAPPLRIYWIPAISLVVGLHYLPMASFFGVPSFWACGAAMIAVAAVVAGMINAGLGSPQVVVAGEAIANAGILWLTAAWGIFIATRRDAR